MAQADVAAMGEDTREPKTAYEVAAADDTTLYTDAENAAAAEAAGVKRASQIDYGVALDAYAARPDIEDLAHKNSRDMPADFEEAAFMRSNEDASGSGSA